MGGVEGAGSTMRAVATRRYERLKRIIRQRYGLPAEPFINFLKGLDYVVLILGPPGTGKTHAVLKALITGQVGGVRLPGVAVESSLYLAFNRSAADDAARRLHAIAVNAVGRERLAGIDAAAHVKTLDAVALASIGGTDRLLRLSLVAVRREDGGVVRSYEPCSGRNCTINDAEEAIEKARMIISSRYKIRYTSDDYEPSQGRALFQLFDFAIHVAGLQRGLEALGKSLAWSERCAVAEYLHMLGIPWFSKEDCLLAADLSKIRYVDFTIANALALWGGEYKIEERLGRHKEVREVETLFLDEFQDLSLLRLNWIPRLFPKARVAVIAGDDDQAVYTGLHGADPGIMKRIYDAIKNGEINGSVVTLSESKRLYEPVAAVARTLISGVKDRIPKDWRGKFQDGVTANVHLVSFDKGLRMVIENHRARMPEFSVYAASGWRQFVLAPTNAEVKEVAQILLSAGIIPMGLKGVPGVVKGIVETGWEACERIKAEEDAQRLGAENLRQARAKYMLEALGARGWRVGQRVVEAVIRAHTCDDFRQLKQFVREVERQRGRDPTWLTRYVTYVDTAHVAKGLEANTVFIVDSTSSEAAVADVRAKYVALTRSLGNVYVMRGGPGKYRWIHELDVVAKVVEL